MISIPTLQLKDIVIKEGLLDAATFDVIAEEAERLKQNIAFTLVSKNILTESYLYQILSKHLNFPLADLQNKTVDESVLRLLPETIARQKRTIAFGKEEDGSISIAFENPMNLETIEFLEQYLKSRVKIYLANEIDLNRGFAIYGKKLVEDFKKIIDDNISLSIKTGKKGEEAAGEVPIVAIVDNIVAYALSLHASDIHMEIFEDGVLVRYRIDGVLHEMMKIPRTVHSAIIARIKILSSLKIDEHYKPQDGRFRYKIGSDEIDIRVAIMPTFSGEKIVMRLLTSATRPLSLREVGMLENTEKIVLENIKKSFGMILVCGPTGSGKTTTLYSILNLLNRPEVNIATIEDPIEYNIKYVNQTQINPAAGITFASGLRAFLRQDPNIIFVGEIRDNETADIATQAALTGHLVLSSLHTNDAPTAVPRFLDMNIPPFLVSATLNAIIAQRLVRKICMECIHTVELDPDLVDAVKVQLKNLEIDKEYQLPKTVYVGAGCASCNHTGYSGRIAIYEVLDVTEDVRNIIVSPAFSMDKLKQVAREQGMITMFEDGLHKVEKGITTVEELLRVVRE